MKLIGWILGIPLIALSIIIAIGNRHDVTVSASPMPFEMTLPVAALIFVCLVLGVFWGGIAGWFAQSRLRTKARNSVFQVEILRRDLDAAEQTIKRLREEAAKTPKNASASDTGAKLPAVPRDAA